MSPDDIKPAATRPADPALFYDRHVFVCTNERPPDHPRGCCLAKGSLELRDYMKSRAKELGIKRVRINTSGCLDRCELGPSVVIYPEGVWYRPTTKADIDEILQTHLIEGGRVTRLMLQSTDRPPKPPKRPG
jgi:(2Fe-2S) ferredoxin